MQQEMNASYCSAQTHTHIQTEVEHNLSMAATGITSHGMDPSFSGPFAARAHYSRQYFVAIDHEINGLPPVTTGQAHTHTHTKWSVILFAPPMNSLSPPFCSEITPPNASSVHSGRTLMGCFAACSMSDSGVCECV